MKHIIIIFSVIFSLIYAESPKYEKSLETAIFQLNNNEYTKSIDVFRHIIDNDSAAMFAQLGLLQARRFQLIEKAGYNYDKSSLFKKSDSLIQFYESRLILEPNNANLHFCLAMAIGLKLRTVLGEKSSFYIIYNGIKALKHIRICDELDDTNADIEFAKGMFEYYISQYPGIIKYFSNLMLENTGDREIGRRRMHQAAEANGFLKTDANYSLAFLYLFIENDPQQALPFVKYLSDTFPANPGFHFLSVFTYLQLNDIDKANFCYVTYLNSLASNNGFYIKEYEKRTCFLDAFFKLKSGDVNLAKSLFNEFVTDYNLELEHLLAIAYVELGKILDSERKHEEAVVYYKKVIKIDNRTYPINLAKKYKHIPYQK